MSSIDKLLIRGIRSFESESGDAATITFLSPLTLITGHNGSGKTTIIECLKYATTGETPPNTKGGAFVNDPKMSDSPSVKAQVRLRFRSVNNQIMTVTRSLSVSVKKTSYTQKTLENVLSTLDPTTGELVSISSKCSEIDTDIPRLLGVSRAILDNVIFCHQEESSWPLSEPSALKKRFDEIFASTKYTSVLESIKSIRKEKAVDLKVMFSNLEFLRRNKDKAEKVREALEKNIDNSAQCQDRIEQLDLEIQKCVEDINLLMAKTKEAQTIEAALNSLSHELNSTRSNIRELDGTFTLYSESEVELQEMLFKHDLSLNTADQERTKLERSKSKASSAIANLQTSVHNNQQSIGQLKALLENNQKKQTERDLLVSEFAQRYTFEGFNSLPLTSRDVQRFINKLEMTMQQKVTDMEQVKSSVRKQEQGIQSELADKRAMVDMSSSVKTRNKSAISSAQGKLRQYNSELSKYKSVELEVQSTERMLEEQEKALSIFKSSEPSLESLESQKRSKMADIEAFESELSKLSEQSTAQIKNAELQAKLTMLKKKFQERQSQIQELITQNSEEFRDALKHDPFPDTLEANLGPVLKEREANYKLSDEAVEILLRELAGQEFQIDNVKSQLSRHRKTIADGLKEIQSECGDESLPEVLVAKEEALEELREQVHDMKTMSTMYGRFIDLASKKHGCPLCSRGFDSTQETQFNAKLRRLMEKAENDDEQELDALEKTVAHLRSLKSTWDSVKRLKADDVPTLEKQLSLLETEMLSNAAALKTAKVESTAILSELDDMRKLLSIAKHITGLCLENGRDQTAIKDLETELICAGSTQSTEEIQAQYSVMKQKVQSARQNLTRLQQEISQTTTDVQKKEQVIRSLRENFNLLTHQLKLKAQVVDQIAETEAMIRTLTEEIEQQEKESQSVAPELNRLNELLRKVIQEGQAKEASAQQVVSELQKNLSKVQMYNKDVERVDSGSTTTELTKLESVTDGYIEEIQQHTNEIQESEKQMQVLQQQASEFKNLQRNINDNLRYRRYKDKVQGLEAKIAEASSKKDAQAQGNYSRQLNRLGQKQSNLTGERAGLKGELRQIQDQKKKYEEELESDYKDVVQKYHENMINCKTTELALEDLEKYSKALQSAIVDYHTMKMEEINKSIKELWTNTYRGTDIDAIEIRSDQEGARANQSYNYRVVMIQRGRAMDMRGRCSAGQKVLASIIIRLALAESFSVSCGILALDEPTTNLDHANIAQLAESLKAIVERHREQSNFQLIIITHDEEFLKMLSLSDYADYYYRIKKNAEQFSTIQRMSIAQGL
ncbi:DNA repair protein rad50 [Lunasporangiospora selenospora]|uniref:DNA repair protein RAD50 n=1 Tax=Lunasporangiospora selenospora TaxID=979761 RepID=A0A9P6KEW2_9FUNG|nr:DNA repair protein rad50 [Lunasporangiospora selenospora]